VDVGSFMPRVRKPVVWTLHDMHALTGGCHYAMGCNAYTRTCGHCPQLGSRVARDLAHASWQRKARAYAHRTRTDLHIVAPSRWLQRAAQQSALLRDFPVHCIPYGIDTALFRPIAAHGLRAALGLSADDRVVLFVADGVGNRRKGFEMLIAALAGLQTPQTLVALSIGPDAPRLQLPLRHIHVGAISSDGLLAALYSVADLSVVPSLADNLPNVVLESLACGTPVVGFDTGGIPDMVRPGETGWLAPVGRVDELCQALQAALSDDARRLLYGQRCREVAEQEYTLDAQARAYAALYPQVIASALERTL
jgi:glycosyltransferase involved in cell wall biosynthesis